MLAPVVLSNASCMPLNCIVIILLATLATWMRQKNRGAELSDHVEKPARYAPRNQKRNAIARFLAMRAWDLLRAPSVTSYTIDSCLGTKKKRITHLNFAQTYGPTERRKHPRRHLPKPYPCDPNKIRSKSLPVCSLKLFQF